MLFFLAKNNVHKFGFTATKKIGNAVVRNRAKRRLRALFREYSSLLNDGSYVFVAKTSLYESTYEKLKSDFEKILIKSKAIKND